LAESRGWETQRLGSYTTASKRDSFQTFVGAHERMGGKRLEAVAVK